MIRRPGYFPDGTTSLTEGLHVLFIVKPVDGTHIKVHEVHIRLQERREVLGGLGLHLIRSLPHPHTNYTIL